ncbi:inositol-tetrakisphosphate 1-kinase 2-like [Nymphaea colorata]|nr:inositol-tetrakisphosphate 1-kinase 2-like [Nymphaea colorata]
MSFACSLIGIGRCTGKCIANCRVKGVIGAGGITLDIVAECKASILQWGVNFAAPKHIPEICGMQRLLVVKPLVLDGTAKSHELFLAYDHISLSKLEQPLVLQKFVNHGGVLFKVYVVGETFKVVGCFSLPDVENSEQSHNVGLVPLPRVSFTSASTVGAYLDPHVADLSPFPLIEKLAGELRQRLKWEPLSPQQHHGSSIVEVYQIIEEVYAQLPLCVYVHAHMCMYTCVLCVMDIPIYNTYK